MVHILKFVKARQNKDGSISMNIEDTAIVGWARTEVKNGKEHKSIRWSTLNMYFEEFGFANKLGIGCIKFSAPVYQ